MCSWQWHPFQSHTRQIRSYYYFRKVDTIFLLTLKAEANKGDLLIPYHLYSPKKKDFVVCCVRHPPEYVRVGLKIKCFSKLMKLGKILQIVIFWGRMYKIRVGNYD